MVAVKAKKTVKGAETNVDELLSPEIWTKNQCNVCQDVCTTREAKISHSKTPLHSKRVAVFKFFTHDVAKLKCSAKPSQLAERYKDRGHEAIGLDCMHELVFSFAETGWWACSLCNDAGYTYDQVDEHLASATHLQCYLEEFHPAKAKKMERGWGLTERLEYLLGIKKQIHDEESKRNAGAVVAPEVIELPWTLELARKKLLLDDKAKDYTVHVIPDDSNNVMVQCQVCHEVLPCRKDYVLEAWPLHKRTEKHARFASIQCILGQFAFDRVAEEERMMTELSEESGVGTLRWKHVDDKVYGPVCGIRYLRTMGRTPLCSLCGVVCEDVDEHFSSEHHLMRFVCTASPRDGWQMMQMSKHARREKLMTMLQATGRENEESHSTKDACPSKLRWEAVEPEAEQMPSFPPVNEPFGFAAQCMSCVMCWQCLPIGEDANAVWNEHVMSNDHIDFAARRLTIEYDDQYFVPLASTVKLLEPNSHGKWVTEQVGDVQWKYQTQTDVGLEYVVEDAEQLLAVCTLCARSYPLGDTCQMGLHIRSLQHMQQYMHVTNRTMLSMVLDTKKEVECEELMLEWIQRNSVSEVNEVRVYNKKKAAELQSWPNIKIRTMQISSLAHDIRPIYDCLSSMVDQVANDREEHRAISAREALQTSGMKEITVTRMALQKPGFALFRCSACDAVIVSRTAHLEEDVWVKHIGSEEHRRRAIAFAENKFSPLYFSPLSSTYTVKPFVQKDPAKKVTWRWNALDKTHDLVLAIVGLEEIVEKKSEDAMITNEANYEDFAAHFFCRVCAVVVGRRAQMLEDHVRSAGHVVAFVNKHYPQTVLELDRLDNNDGGKERRKVLATLLKDIKPPSEYCIPVYDPIGESERRQKEAELKHKQREAIKKNEEMRVKVMEERKKKDEERRKMKEEEQKRDKQREEERKKREAMVMEKAAQLTAERERLRKVAMEKAALADIARKKEEMAKAQSQLTRDPGIAALLNTKNEIAAQLEALRARKVASSVPEPKLVIPGPNQLSTSAGGVATLPTVRIGSQPLQQQLPPTSLHQQPQQNPMMMMMQQQPPPQQQQPSMMMGAPPGGYSSMMPGMPGMPNMSLPPPGMIYGGAPPPAGLMTSVSTFAVPPPSLMSVPPPSLLQQPPPSMQQLQQLQQQPGSGSSIADLVGPKPVLSTFVPKVDAMPVYPEMGGGGRGGSNGRVGDWERPSLAGACPDLYVTNPAIITNRQALVDYMWKQGNEEAPERERPARFSRMCAATPACLGTEYIYEVVCLDSGDMTTFYCSMCAYWSTPADILKHMLTSSHRLAYLFRNYKLYHRTVESEPDIRAKEILLEQFAAQIRSRDNPPPSVTHRLKCFLNATTIHRLWPQCTALLDHSWRSNPACRTPSPSPARRRSSRSRSRSFSSDSRSRSYSRSRSRSRDRYRRSRSRDNDRHKRSRSRGRSRSRSPRHHGRDTHKRRSYSRSRSGTPVQQRWQQQQLQHMQQMQPQQHLQQPAPPAPSMMMNSMMGMGMGSMMSVPPPGLMPNTNLPPPTLTAPPRAVPPPAMNTPITISLDDDDDMQISTTPPGSAEKKKEKREREREEKKEKERGRDRGDKEREKDRDRESRRDKDKSSTPKESRSSRRESGGKKEREKEKEKEREREREREKKKMDPAEILREEQMKKALERVKELERAKKVKEEEEREKKRKENEERTRKDRRERSRERDDRRKRSASPSRKRRRSESRERRNSHRSSNGAGADGGEQVDWDAKAAAFLAKIGDMQGASKLLRETVPQSTHTPASAFAASRMPQVYGGMSGIGMAAADSTSSPAVEPLEPSPMMDFGAPATMAATAAAPAAKKGAARQSRSPAYSPIYDESAPSGSGRPSSSMGGASAAGAAGAAASVSEDTEVTKRKLLGVLVTMQQETEQGRELSEKDVDRIYKEVGLTNQRDKNEALLSQLIEMVGGKPAVKKPSINLQDYGISSSSPGQHGGSPYAYGGTRGGAAPPPGYGSSNSPYYGGSPRDAPPRSIPGLAGADMETLEALKSLSKSLAVLQRGGGPRGLPMPPGFGRPTEYDRREAYPPSAYPPYASPPDDDPRRARRPLPYDDPRDRYMDPRDPRADPRMRDRYADEMRDRLPPLARPAAGPPVSTDPRYRGYYEDVYERDRERGAIPPQSAYGAYERGDPRAPLAPPPRPDPRDPRDVRERDPMQPPGRPSMDLPRDPRLYEAPPPRADRPVLTREEYEARLRGEIPATQPTGAAPPKPAAAAPAVAAPAAQKQQAQVITLDDDDDWGSLEEMLDNSKQQQPAASAAPAAAAAGGGQGKRPMMSPPSSGAAAAAAGGGAAPTMTAAEAAADAGKQYYLERQARAREHWGVRNKATPMPQTHLAAPAPAAAARPPQQQQPQQPPHTRGPMSHQLQQQQQQRQPATHSPPVARHQQQQQQTGPAVGGQWDAQYAAPQRPQQHQQHPQQQQQQQGYYGSYSQYGNGQSGGYGGGGYY